MPSSSHFPGKRHRARTKAKHRPRGKQITTLALDGFGTKIAKADLDAEDWILATNGNGRPFGIGQRGPLWLVFDPPGDRPATQEEEGKWPWAIFFIHAE